MEAVFLFWGLSPGYTTVLLFKFIFSGNPFDNQTVSVTLSSLLNCYGKFQKSVCSFAVRNRFFSSSGWEIVLRWEPEKRKGSRLWIKTRCRRQTLSLKIYIVSDFVSSFIQYVRCYKTFLFLGFFQIMKYHLDNLLPQCHRHFYFSVVTTQLVSLQHISFTSSFYLNQSFLECLLSIAVKRYFLNFVKHKSQGNILESTRRDVQLGHFSTLGTSISQQHSRLIWSIVSPKSKVYWNTKYHKTRLPRV